MKRKRKCLLCAKLLAKETDDARYRIRTPVMKMETWRRKAGTDGRPTRLGLWAGGSLCEDGKQADHSLPECRAASGQKAAGAEPSGGHATHCSLLFSACGPGPPGGPGVAHQIFNYDS